MGIWLARHGSTEWSRSGRHTGTTDLPLDDDGEQEARALGEVLRAHPFVRVLSSPMARALETARLAGFDRARVEVSPLLREVDYGAYEGMRTKDITASRPGWELFRDGSPGGEMPLEISRRADTLLALVGQPSGDVLMFGHGHMLRAMATRYLGLQIWVASLLSFDAGAVSILGSEHGHAALALWNMPAVQAERT